MCASLRLQPAPGVHSADDKWEIPGKTLAVKRPGLLPIDSGLKPWSLELVRPCLGVTTRLRGKCPELVMLLGVSFRRDGTHLNGKLQNHVDDSFPATGKVEPFREPDPEAPKRQDRTER